MKLKAIKFLDDAVEYSIYGMIFFIPISISLIGIFAGIAIICFLIKKSLAPDLSVIKNNKVLFLLLLVFFIFMGLSLFNSGALFNKSLKALLTKWARFPLLLWIIIDTFRDTKSIARAAYVFLLSATLVGLTVFTQKFFGFEFLRGRVLGNPLVPVTGPFTNQNGLAAYLTCVIPIVLALGLWFYKKITVRVLFFLIIGMLFLASFWTNCRGGWLGLIAGLIFIILVFNYSRIKKVFWPVFLASYLLVPIAGFALFFYQNRGSSNRGVIYQGAWEMIKEHPLLGKGLGTFMDYCASYTNNFGAYYAHNCYLQMWAESGIFSLLSFLLIAGYVFYKSIETILGMVASLENLILIGMTAGLSGYLVHAFFEVHLYSFELSFLFWTVLGLAIALMQTMRTRAA